MAISKKIYVSWNTKDQAWVLRFWSDVDQEYKIDSTYPCKDPDDDDIGFVSELLLLRLANLQDQGYSIVMNIV